MMEGDPVTEDSTVEYIQMEELDKRPSENTVVKWYRDRSDLEKWLLLSLLFAGALISALIPLSLTQYFKVHEPSQFCDSPPCVQKAAQILSGLNPVVSPCEDFYGFSCGNYWKGKSTEISTTPFTLLQDSIYGEIKGILEMDKNEDLRAYKLVTNFYKSCLNTSRLEAKGLDRAKELLMKAGGWPILTSKNEPATAGVDWSDMIVSMRNLGLPFQHFFELDVHPDIKNSTQFAIYLDQPSFEIGVGTDVDADLKKEYLDYKKDLAILFGANESEVEENLNQVIQFENALKNLTLSQKERSDPKKLYNPYTASQLWSEIPQIPWTSLLNKLFPLKIYLKKEEKIIVKCPTYFFGLGKLLENTPKRVLANYAMWRVVSTISEFLNEKSRKIRETFDKPDTKLRWKECIEVLSDSNIGGALGSLYTSKIDMKIIPEAQKMFKVLKESFKEEILENTWMDITSKSRALDKLEGMKNSLDYLPEILNETQLNSQFTNVYLNDVDYLDNHLNLTKFGVDYKLGKLRGKSLGLLDEVGSTSSWYTIAESSLQANAFYSQETNTIVIPPAILQNDYFSELNVPYYLNLASLGWILAHEISHGFDSQGRLFDKNGNLGNWWEVKTERRYKEKANCLQKQYDQMSINLTGKGRGEVTIDEDIADNVGIKIAHRAFKNLHLLRLDGLRQEKVLVGLGGFGIEELFWLEAAQTFCGQVGASRLRILNLNGDPHSTKALRVNGPFANTLQFSADFNCPQGSTMNPSKKCAIW